MTTVCEKSRCARASRSSIAKAASARVGFAWGSSRAKAKIVYAPIPTARLRVIATIEKIAYQTTKGSIKRGSFEHTFEGQNPLLARPASGSTDYTISSRGAPRARGALFQLGTLLDVSGVDVRGREVRVGFPRGQYDLASDNRKRMHIVSKVKGAPAFHVVTNRSKYSITDRGIIR